MEAIFLVGLPGSGKSTYVKQLLSQKGDYRVVSMDLIRERLGICSEGKKGIGSKEQEKMIRQMEADEITSLVRDGFSIIIDDTNLRSEKRLSQVRIIKEINQNYKIKYVLVKTDVETCIQRRAGEIPADIIRMFNAQENWIITDDEKNFVDEVLEVFRNKFFNDGLDNYAIVDGYLCRLFQINDDNDPECARVVWQKLFYVKVEVSLTPDGNLNVIAAEDGYNECYSAPSEYEADVLGRGGSTYTSEVKKGQTLRGLSEVEEITTSDELLSKVDEIEGYSIKGYSLTMDDVNNKYAIM